MSFAIDAVITWVDGDDPVLAAKRERYRPEMQRAHRNGAIATRFSDLGEIYVCIASLLKYAPFLRKIWIVTDGQRPAQLNAFNSDKITVVDHSEIFAGCSQYLPTFNSNSIEARIWAIPGLAPHFLYLNDDMMLTAPVKVEDLFAPDGRPKLHGDWENAPEALGQRLSRIVMTRIGMGHRLRPTFRASQRLSGRLAGLGDRYLRIDHHPHPLRVDTLRRFYAAHPDVADFQLSQRFRHRLQHSVIALANHLEWKENAENTLPAWPLIYWDPDMSSPIDDALEGIATGAAPFACLQSLDAVDRASLTKVRNVLRNVYSGYLPEDICLLGEKDPATF